MQIVFSGDNLHEISKPVFWEKIENISICHLLKILSRVISVNGFTVVITSMFTLISGGIFVMVLEILRQRPSCTQTTI